MLDDSIARCRERIAALASGALSRARDEGDLAELLGAAWAIVEEELASGRPAQSPAPACGPGCAACCTLNVGTLAVEGAVAAALLRRSVPATELPALGATLRGFHDRVRWLEDGERIESRARCPLLDAAGRCTIHPVRPLACRSVSSLDAADCRRVMAAGADEEDGRVVRMDLLQRALYLEALAAAGEAVARRGLDARCRDVTGMVGLFLADPALAPAFLAGRRLPLE